ncbi:MAG: 6-phosphofructokinase [Clostridia bacterium]|nr:6-phosphofructokinase [Clostridia bacterium]
MSTKKIAVLTSGGDAPGMNAAVRAVVRTAISFGMEVYAVRHGYNGLLTGEVEKMDLRSVSNIIQRGGTALLTARSPEYNTPAGVKKAADKCREMGIDGVVVVGGDGSFRGARDLTGAGIPCIGIPGTIDNDIACTDYTIGYDTAMNTAMEMIDKIRETTESHDRCNVVEVMGRRCGDIALNTGIAVGAISTLVPEVEYDFEKDVIERIKKAQETGKHHFIVVVAEGIGHVEEICKKIEAATGIESRVTILGHVQRGGSPTVHDRVVASRMGYYAVELLRDGKSNRVLAMKGEDIIDLDITEALDMPRVFDEKLYKISMELSR